jgi:exodeoxyribonuclease VIII
MQNIMLYLETLGNSANSVIIAIGAVKFDSTGLGEEFYEVIDAESCVQDGLTMEASTAMWWMQQSDEARWAFKRSGVTLPQVLEKFVKFCGCDTIRINADMRRVVDTTENMKIWGNGASFDNTILSNAYRKTSIKQPWAFWNDRCYRTMKSLYPQVVMARQGTYHNALDDAKSQAAHMVEIAKVAGVTL